jgi:hypothetical protein
MFCSGGGSFVADLGGKGITEFVFSAVGLAVDVLVDWIGAAKVGRGEESGWDTAWQPVNNINSSTKMRILFIVFLLEL